MKSLIINSSFSTCVKGNTFKFQQVTAGVACIYNKATISALQRIYKHVEGLTHFFFGCGYK